MPRTVLVSPLRTWKSPDFHQGQYTEKSPIRQEFVGCNRDMAAEKSNLVNSLGSVGHNVGLMEDDWVVQLSDHSLAQY
jgi:hypothetical protein